MEFLLKSEARHEDGTADQKYRENEQDVKNFQARQLGQRVCRNRENARHGKCTVSGNGGGFVPHLLLSSEVASRNNRSSVVVDLRRAINFAFELVASVLI